MCGIAGIYNPKNQDNLNLNKALKLMNQIQSHRGPDDDQVWVHDYNSIGFAHRRLSIIDLKTGTQPMTDHCGNTICYNGEIYNFIELRDSIKNSYSFRTSSDTEVILAAYEKWGESFVDHLRGMFSFALWDNSKKQLVCVRDRFGIKPFYYLWKTSSFYFASEAKALLPFLENVETDLNSLKDYLAFQFCLGDKTLFKNVKQLLPGHYLLIKNDTIQIKKYWEVNYTLDWNHTDHYFKQKITDLLNESVRLHMRSDVPVGAYLSGGIDSSLISILSRKQKQSDAFLAFTGKFTVGPEYDESSYARIVSESNNFNLHEIDITSQHFLDYIQKIIYHLDYPIAGPGSFPQFMVSNLASRYLKVVVGGQGGDEIFGGYVRYLIAYFEQCIKGAIEGTMNSGKFIVTYESIIPNLASLKNYKPLLQEFWQDGLFDERDRRYFRLINRSNAFYNEINWQLLEPYSAFETFREIFWAKNVEKESYFDSMTHFDFKTLLPALLHVEDRMSMAHGLESRVPMLDHPLVEFVATIPSNVKFRDGELKHLVKSTFGNFIPKKILQRKDKMGFPVPLTEWMQGELKEFVSDLFHSTCARQRPYLNPNFDIASLISKETKFSRKLWGLLCLELWQQQFHDKHYKYSELS